MDRGELKSFFSYKTFLNRFKWGTNNGVFYFLGNVPSHINHALPLYRKIGGTFVVLSKDAFEYCKTQNVDVLCIDDNPDLFLQFSQKQVRQTIDYLNTHAKVVLYYEIYPIVKNLKAKQLMLTHGNALKDYYIEWRQEYMPYYDFIAGIGPALAEITKNAGVAEEKILNIGLARSDEIVKNRRKKHAAKRKVTAKLHESHRLKIVSYMPTWWGPTSVNDTGKALLRCLSEEYIVIFRPHPSTPREVIEEYVNFINDERLNTFYIPEGNEWRIPLNDILIATDVFIGDVSSVVLDALLADLPILIAYGSNDRRQDVSAYKHIKPALEAYPAIDMENVAQINAILETTLSHKIEEESYTIAKEAVFYGLTGDNVRRLKQVIRSLVV